jgi:hypothetical protein
MRSSPMGRRPPFGVCLLVCLVAVPVLLLGVGPVGSSGPVGASTAAASTACPYQVALARADGSVSTLGPSGDTCPSRYYGSMAGQPLNQPIVGMASTSDGGGYWLVASDGGIFAFGNAGFYGSMGGQPLNRPIVGMASTPDGGGYWLVASDGGIFAFGNARFSGSMGGVPLNQPVVGMATDGSTGGYWLVAADGGVFAFDAPFYGSMGGQHLNAPVAFVTGTPDNGGYRMVASDGGVFDFGDARFFGSAAIAGSSGWEALAPTPDGGGYWLFAGSSTQAFGDAAASLAVMAGNTSTATVVGAAILGAGTGTGKSSAGGWFNAVSCPNTSMCMAVGWTGTGAGLVEVSTDGARSFQSVAIPIHTPMLAAVTCLSAVRCLAVGRNTILSTDDAGSSWTSSHGGTLLTGVACQSTTHCMAVGESSNIHIRSFIYTTNGRTWSKSSAPAGNVANGVSCNRTACIAAGWSPYASTDGGRTWKQKGVFGGSVSAELLGVSCIPGTSTCLLVGSGAHNSTAGELVVTTDSGGSFVNKSSLLPRSTGTAAEVSCSAPEGCGIAGYPALFLWSGATGRSWSKRPGPSGSDNPDAGYPHLTDLGISCPSPGWCVVVGHRQDDPNIGAAGAVTSNAGSTWTASVTQ